MVLAIPEGVPNAVPYLCIRGAKKAIEFYQKAFSAQVMSVMPMGDIVAHADLKIGASRVYLAEEMPGWGPVQSPKSLKGTSANIHLWVEDCDASFAQAVAAGAKVAMPLVDQFWGDRYGMVLDPFGHAWAITSHKEDLTPEEMMRRGAEAMAQMPPPPKPEAKSKGSKKQAKKAAAAKAKPAKKVKPAKKAKSDKKAKAGKSKKSKKDKKRKKKSKR